MLWSDEDERREEGWNGIQSFNRSSTAFVRTAKSATRGIGGQIDKRLSESRDVETYKGNVCTHERTNRQTDECVIVHYIL